MTSLLQAAGLTWTRDGDVRAAVVVDGITYAVLIPSSSVRFVIERHAAAEGLSLPSGVGAVDLVGWFGSSLVKKARKAAKGVYRKAKRVARKTVRTIKSTAKKAASTGANLWKHARKLATSDEFSYLVLRSSVVCPAVGGPAFAALKAAQQADRMLKTGSKAASTIRRNVRAIATAPSRTPKQRLLLSALQSTR